MKILLILIALIKLYNANLSSKNVCHYEDVTLTNHTNFGSYSCWFCYENIINNKNDELVREKHDCGGDVPSIKIGEKCLPFDHKINSIKAKVQVSMSNLKNYNHWKRCCDDAESCCKSLNEMTPIETFDEACSGYWDKYEENCYPLTLHNETIQRPCPDLFSYNDISSCQYFKSKKCAENSNWTETDSSQCFPANRIRSNSMIYITILSASLVVCGFTILIFAFDKEVRTKHFKLFALLITIILIRHSFIIALKCLISFKTKLLENNNWWCRLLSIASQFFNTFEYFLLFFLVYSLKCHFRDEKLNKSFLLSGICVTFFTTFSWSMLMAFTMNKLCWNIDLEQPQHWINDSIRIFIFITTFYFLMLILWDRNHERKIYEANDMKTKFSSSKFLIIILLTYLIEILLRIYLTFYPPCEWEITSIIILQILDASKGIFLSIFIIIHSKIWSFCKSLPNLKFLSNQPTTESNVNLSLPRNFSAKALNQQETVDWDNFVAHARKSISERNENFYSAEPRPLSVSSQPDPTRSRFSIISQDSISGSHLPRDSLRSIMFRAKHNMSREESIANHHHHQLPISPMKIDVPIPVPKNIPDAVLDDVQLFEYYYNNLSSLNSSSSDVQRPEEIAIPVDNNRRSSFNKFTRKISLSKPNSKPNSRLSRMKAFDESANENTIENSEIN